MSDPTKTQVGGDHYRKMKIQPEAFIFENGIGFHEGNAIKYLCRWKEKGGVQDLEKARHYIDLLIAHASRDGLKKDFIDNIIEKERERSEAIPLSVVFRPPPGLDPANPADWHNPRGIASAGDGYRFCLKGETRADATHYWDSDELTWSRLPKPDNAALAEMTTYRTNKPLPQWTSATS